jgi:hypothetical protein
VIAVGIPAGRVRSLPRDEQMLQAPLRPDVLLLQAGESLPSLARDDLTISNVVGFTRLSAADVVEIEPSLKYSIVEP